MLWYTGGAYATSQDGIHWDKPTLGLREHQGSTQNNLMLPVTKYEFTDGSGKEIASVKGDGTIILKVFYDANEPDPARRYKGIGYKGPLCCLRKSQGPASTPPSPPTERVGSYWTPSFQARMNRICFTMRTTASTRPQSSTGGPMADPCTCR